MEKAAYQFGLHGKPIMCNDFGHGNINYTFLITTDAGYQYILQRINKHVFKDPVKLMENVIAVSEHIRSKENGVHNSLHFLKDKNDEYC